MVKTNKNNMKEVKFLRVSLIKDSEISLDEALGTNHYRATYDNGNLVKHETIDPEGNVLNTSCYEHHNGYIKGTFFNENMQLRGVTYSFEEDNIFKESAVSFDANGQVRYPQPSRKRKKKLEILKSVRLIPSNNYHQEFENEANSSIQLYFPRKKDIFRIDHADARKALADLKIDVPLIHGPNMNFNNPDFIPHLAWIRGNYGNDIITIHPDKGNFGSTAQYFKENDEEISRLGLRLAYENMDARDRWFVNPEQLMFLDSENVGLTLDLSHLEHGTDLLDLEERIFDKLDVVHLSNRTRTKKHLPYREGDLPVQAFLQSLRSKEYQGKIVLEYSNKHKEQEEYDTQKLKDFFG